MEGKTCCWSARLHSPLFPVSGHRQVRQRDHPAGPPPARGVSDHRCKCMSSPLGSRWASWRSGLLAVWWLHEAGSSLDSCPPAQRRTSLEKLAILRAFSFSCVLFFSLKTTEGLTSPKLKYNKGPRTRPSSLWWSATQHGFRGDVCGAALVTAHGGPLCRSWPQATQP